MEVSHVLNRFRKFDNELRERNFIATSFETSIHSDGFRESSSNKLDLKFKFFPI